MGKNNRSRSRKAPPSSATPKITNTEAQTKLQELMHHIGGVSLQDARREVRAVEALLQRLKEAQQDDLSTRKSAPTQLAKRSEKFESGSTTHREVRHESETQHAQREVKDWYLGFDELKEVLVPELKSLGCEGDAGKILIIGAGKSLLGEQLWEQHFRNILAIDASETAVKEMQERRGERGLDGLTYKSMDARALALTDNCISAVIDRGALEVVLSSDSVTGLASAKDIISEVFRVLQPHGTLILVSTIPAQKLLGIFSEQYRLDSIPLRTACDLDVWFHRIRNTAQPMGSMQQQLHDLSKQFEYLKMERDRASSELLKAQEIHNVISQDVDRAQEAQRACGHGVDKAWTEYMEKAAADSEELAANEFLYTAEEEYVMVRVSLAVSYGTSSLIPNGHVRVLFDISSDYGRFQPSDSDSICLILPNLAKAVFSLSSNEVAVTQPQLQISRFEGFEYLPSNCQRQGHVDIRLPSVSGVFSVVFVPAPRPQGRFSFVHTSTLEQCTISTPIFVNLSSAPVPLKGDSHSFRVLVEDMESINTLQFYIFPTVAGHHLNRCRLDLFSLSGAAPAGGVVSLNFEDVCSENSQVAVSQGVLHWKIPTKYAVDGAGCKGQVSVDFINLRMPYRRSDTWVESATDDLPGWLLKRIREHDLCSSMIVRCGFCGNHLLEAFRGPSEFKALPTGHFDSMIQDITCCENPIQNLAASDITARQGQILLSDAAVLLHPEDVFMDQITVQRDNACSEYGKEHDSLSVIRYETSMCYVRCRRCDYELGEAFADLREGNVPDMFMSDRLNILDVRFFYTRVELSPKKSSFCVPPRVALTVEQYLCGVLRSAVTAHGCFCVCVYTPDSKDRVCVIRSTTQQYRVHCENASIASFLPAACSLEPEICATNTSTLCGKVGEECVLDSREPVLSTISATRVCYRDSVCQKWEQVVPEVSPARTMPAFICEVNRKQASDLGLCTAIASQSSCQTGVKCQWVALEHDEYILLVNTLRTSTFNLPQSQSYACPFAGYSNGFLRGHGRVLES